jgi:hypothetical protein
VHKRFTVGEARWPETPEFSVIAELWNEDVLTLMLGYVWQGYALLCSDLLGAIDVNLADEQLERSITQYLTPKVRQCMTGDEPFDVEQGVFEFEKRFSASAQPPLYDLAFVLKSNPRIMWPLEAKLLRTEGAVGEYVKEIRDNFLTCRYAPFSKEGAMLGYLMSGTPPNAFENIRLKLPCVLEDHPKFGSQDHKISSHTRPCPAETPYPANFLCHHLILQLKR